MKSLKARLKRWLTALDGLLMPLARRFPALAALYYLGFSRAFDREHSAVLAGRLENRIAVRGERRSSYRLRRSVHRIEKGLIMRPRRPVFAEDYIGEVVGVVIGASRDDAIDVAELKWARDVLDEYFATVDKTPTTMAANAAYVAAFPTPLAGERFAPFTQQPPDADAPDYDALAALVRRRRSVRWFREAPVPFELMERAIDLASTAPSACNRQPFVFYVSSNPETARKMAACAGGAAGFSSSLQCVVAVVGDLAAYGHERDRHAIYVDGSLAAMQLILALESQGLATCVINWADVAQQDDRLSRIIGSQSYERTVMLIAVGFPDTTARVPYSKKRATHLMFKMVP
jgi:nitroreductase